MPFKLPEVVQRDLNRPLPADAEEQAIHGARRDAIFAAVIGSRFMGFGRTQMMLSALGSGVLSGYYFNQAFVAANMMEVQKEKERLKALGIHERNLASAISIATYAAMSPLAARLHGRPKRNQRQLSIDSFPTPPRPIPRVALQADTERPSGDPGVAKYRRPAGTTIRIRAK
ncbi:hypothetical protein C8R45DRAFT_1096253 [Mycena sanguinolenta]|nr:hypothetical protein C8R45DRAFT_1096253 [Mycena sanguinolenta]